MFKVNNRNTRRKCEICSKLTIKILERRQWIVFSYIINNVNIIWISLIGQRFWGEKVSQDKNFRKFISAYDFWV